MIPDVKDWNITILATDINNNFLKKASEGVYTKWSFREAPSWIRESYFKKTKEDKYEILPLKKMVSFSYLNLADDTYPSLSNNINAMDIIFCRNVLIYFLPEQAKQVIQKLYHSLMYGGWLILGASETSFAQHSQFVTVNYPGVTFHRKERRGSRTIEDLIPKETPFYWKQEEEIVPYKTHLQKVNESEQKITLMKKPRESILAEVDKQKTEKPEQKSYSKAKELYEHGRFAEAVEKLLDLYPENQKDTKLIVLLARAYANQGKFTDSLKWCDKAIVLEKMNPAFHYLRALILNEQGLVEEAVLSLKRVLYLEKNFVLAHFILGNLSKQQGKIKEANKHFRNTLSLLHSYAKEDILPESEGITAGRLSEIIALKMGEFA
jgi:chemotaxis protein methyltransferase CheR